MFNLSLMIIKTSNQQQTPQVPETTACSIKI